MSTASINKKAKKAITFTNYSELIKEYKKRKNMTFQEISDYISNTTGAQVDVDTVKKVCSRNSQSSIYIDNIMDALDISNSEKKHFMMSDWKKQDIAWMFQSKTEEGQSIILELTKNLFLMEAGYLDA